MSHPYRQRSQTSMQGTRNESIPPNPKTQLSHDVNPHTRKTCNAGFRVTEGKRQNFIPRTPGKVRLVEVQAPMAMCYFNPRTPGGVRLSTADAKAETEQYFNPRTPGGVRPSCCAKLTMSCNFNPRTPGGVRQDKGGRKPKAQKDFNPRTPGGVRP